MLERLLWLVFVCVKILIVQCGEVCVREAIVACVCVC